MVYTQTHAPDLFNSTFTLAVMMGTPKFSVLAIPSFIWFRNLDDWVRKPTNLAQKIGNSARNSSIRVPGGYINLLPASFPSSMSTITYKFYSYKVHRSERRWMNHALKVVVETLRRHEIQLAQDWGTGPWQVAISAYRAHPSRGNFENRHHFTIRVFRPWRNLSSLVGHIFDDDSTPMWYTKSEKPWPASASKRLHVPDDLE
ncbi:hypothetical protein BDN72DRAFT_906100 [Pluteus cervinus]|uniref:Uncharacterized protein n=1 Tax=Pluteus cervinus TaxID=181527 RepID=A0ACD2ZZZ5_9AGAR|nr:hypothetical protein BDN72DRAFT_906100 [Pluteus cervinus]